MPVSWNTAISSRLISLAMRSISTRTGRAMSSAMLMAGRKAPPTPPRSSTGGRTILRVVGIVIPVRHISFVQAHRVIATLRIRGNALAFILATDGTGLHQRSARLRLDQVRIGQFLRRRRIQWRPGHRGMYANLAQYRLDVGLHHQRMMAFGQRRQITFFDGLKKLVIAGLLVLACRIEPLRRGADQLG